MSVIVFADCFIFSRDVGGVNSGFIEVRCSIIFSSSDMKVSHSEEVKMFRVVTLCLGSVRGGRGYYCVTNVRRFAPRLARSPHSPVVDEPLDPL